MTTKEPKTYEQYREKAESYYNLVENSSSWLGATADGDSDLSNELVTVTLTGTELARATAGLVSLAVGSMQDIALLSGRYNGAIEALDTAELLYKTLSEARDNLTTTTTTDTTES